MIYDVCANNDCSIGEEARIDDFDTHAEWEAAHARCYQTEDGDCRR